MKKTLITLLLFVTTCFAQDVDYPNYDCNPFQIPDFVNASPVTKLFYMKGCIEWKTNFRISNSKELEVLGDYQIRHYFKNYYSIFLETFPIAKKYCDEKGYENKECGSFKQFIEEHRNVNVDFFHTLFFIDDFDLLVRWYNTISIADVNDYKIKHPIYLRAAKGRTTLVEIAAGHPLSSMNVLKFLGEQKLLNVNSRSSYPLHVAIINGQYDRFKYLLDYGYDINTLDEKDFKQYFKEEQRKLLDDDEQGQSPLHRSIIYRRLNIFKDLMSFDHLDINKPTLLREETPLSYAAYMAIIERKSQKDVMFDSLLKDSRIDINQANSSGHTILNAIVSHMMLLTASKKQKYLIRDIINHKSFKPEMHCNSNNRCIQPAFISGSIDILKMFGPLASYIDYDVEKYFFKKDGPRYNILDYTKRFAFGRPTFKSRLQYYRLHLLLKKWKRKYVK